MRRRLPFPPPRKLPWALKSLDSARTGLGYDHLGRMVLTIEHDIVRGVSPKMIAWWFGNIAGDIEIDGVVLDRYLAWHPEDHILWGLAAPGPDGGASAGAKFRIVEASGRNPEFYVDVVETVARLDETGLTLVGRHFGLDVVRLTHDFHAHPNGTRYVSMLRVGLSIPRLGPILNPAIHRFAFSEVMGRAWLKHNVEEVGLLEHILPRIYPG